MQWARRIPLITVISGCCIRLVGDRWIMGTPRIALIAVNFA
jgi:hypothetical protein